MPRGSRRRFPSGLAKGRRAPPSCRPRSPTLREAVRRCRGAAERNRPVARSGVCRSPSISPTAAACWAPCRRRSGSCSSGSSTKAAGCRWCCTRRSAAGSTAPGDWPCASGSAAGLASSCRPPPTKRRSSSRWDCKHSFPLEDVFDYLHPNSVQESAHAGGARSADVRIALAMERHPIADARAVPERQGRAAADHPHAGRRSARRKLSRGGRLPGKSAAGRSCKSRWTIRWSGRRSTIA